MPVRVRVVGLLSTIDYRWLIVGATGGPVKKWSAGRCGTAVGAIKVLLPESLALIAMPLSVIMFTARALAASVPAPL